MIRVSKGGLGDKDCANIFYREYSFWHPIIYIM